MSGHSRWSQIKHKKSTADEKKGQLFSKLANRITLIAKSDPNPETNIKLRSSIEEAKRFNLPKENIESALNRAKLKEDPSMEDLLLEATGPNNLALLIRVVTDNNNRVIAEIKSILQKHNLKIVPEGSIKWQFDNVGFIELETDTKASGKENLFLELIDLGAEDIENKSNELILYTKPENLEILKTNLIKNNYGIQDSGLGFRPKTPVRVAGDQRKILEDILKDLNNHPEVEGIYANWA